MSDYAETLRALDALKQRAAALEQDHHDAGDYVLDLERKLKTLCARVQNDKLLVDILALSGPLVALKRLLVVPQPQPRPRYVPRLQVVRE